MVGVSADLPAHLVYIHDRDDSSDDDSSDDDDLTPGEQYGREFDALQESWAKYKIPYAELRDPSPENKDGLKAFFKLRPLRVGADPPDKYSFTEQLKLNIGAHCSAFVHVSAPRTHRQPLRTRR